MHTLFRFTRMTTLASILLCSVALSGCDNTNTVALSPTPNFTATPLPIQTGTPTTTLIPTQTVTPTPLVSPAPVALNTDPNTYTYLINRDYPLSADYAPNDLVVPNVKFSFSDMTLDKAKLRKEAATALENLFQAAYEEQGYSLYGVSGYRSYERQYTLYSTYLILQGVRHTNLYSAAPGMSEHQTGLTIDVSSKSADMQLEDIFGETDEGKWLAQNAHRFGYIIRYPKDKEHITGYSYESWHIRYVGINLATYLFEQDMTLDEYYGYTPSYTLEELADKPLIDTTTEKFLAIYETYYPPQPDDRPILDWAGNVIVDASGNPYYKEVILGKDGKPLMGEGKVFYYKEAIFSPDGELLLSASGKPYFLEPIYSRNGKLLLTKQNTPYFLNPVFKEDGTLRLTSYGSPVFLEPLFNSDGTLVLDEQSIPVFAPFVEPTKPPLPDEDSDSNSEDSSTDQETEDDTDLENPSENETDTDLENPSENENDTDLESPSENENDTDVEGPSENENDTDIETPSESENDTDVEIPSENENDTDLEIPSENENDTDVEIPSENETDSDFENNNNVEDSENNEYKNQNDLENSDSKEDKNQNDLEDFSDTETDSEDITTTETDSNDLEESVSS